ncbi:MAG: hypothetical protein ACREJ5_18290 [Geminicoccaceae bacterium]
MPKALYTVLGLCVALSAPELAEARPTILTPQDMDAVTAGAIEVGALSAATASGAFNFTNTNSAVAAFSAQGSDPAISTQVGAASGTAVGVGAGEGASSATSVSTAGSVDGTFVVGSSINWTLAVLSGEISGGFTVVSGHTGAFLLGGP